MHFFFFILFGYEINFFIQLVDDFVDLHMYVNVTRNIFSFNSLWREMHLNVLCEQIHTYVIKNKNK